MLQFLWWLAGWSRGVFDRCVLIDSNPLSTLPPSTSLTTLPVVVSKIDLISRLYFYDPDGEYRTSKKNSGTVTPDKVGVWTLYLETTQSPGNSWDVQIYDTVADEEISGRLHSYQWNFNAGSFSVRTVGTCVFVCCLFVAVFFFFFDPLALPCASACVFLTFFFFC